MIDGVNKKQEHSPIDTDSKQSETNQTENTTPIPEVSPTSNSPKEEDNDDHLFNLNTDDIFNTAVDINLSINNDPLKEGAKTDNKKVNYIKRWITGLSLTFFCALWLSSPTFYFSFLFYPALYLAQNEFYNMAEATGVKIQRKLSIFSSFINIFFIHFLPLDHISCLAFSFLFLIVSILLQDRPLPKLSEISVNCLGLFYLGYLPSFWIRIHALNGLGLESYDPNTSYSNIGAWCIALSWASVAASDVGAYFGGKLYGSYKLSIISSAAGAASPNKTLQGFMGGFAFTSCWTLTSAYLMSWPYWPLTGFTYGFLICFFGLIGDLFASILKRDAKFKDTGSILPGHGGLLDRVDSYIFTAPVCYFFLTKVLAVLSSKTCSA